MNTKRIFMVPLVLCLLGPLHSEQSNQSEAFFPQDVEIKEKSDEANQTSSASLLDYEKNLQKTPQQLQQQGMSSAYDRNSTHQDHPANLPQAPSQQDFAIGKPESPAGHLNFQDKFIVEAEDDQDNSAKELTPPPKNINPPARPPLTSALNLWLNGEALLWQATEENLTYVYKTDLVSNYDLKTVDFEWDWGFRVSGGYNIPRDGWDLSLMWTHLENHASDSQRAHLDDSGAGIGSEPFLQAAWGINDFSPPAGTISRASAHWTVHLDQVDFAVAREYFVGSHLAVRPNCGLRAAWIDQDYKVTYTLLTAAPQKFRMDNRFFGFGFAAGADSDWLLGRGFSLYGMADFAILLGYFKVDQKVTQLAPVVGVNEGNLDSSFRCGRGILDLSLGLKWSHLFSHESWGLTFKAGYEYHLYFDQNQLSNITSTTPTFRYNKAEGNLIYQGVSLSGQFDF